MLSYNDMLTSILLSRLLNGSYSIINYIISIKNDKELLEEKEFYIEKDFYNWLTYDINIRRIIKEDYSVVNELNIPLINYYRLNKSYLGLNNNYRRNISLSECFQSNWWKYTQKKNIEWENIHKVIRSNIKVFFPRAPDYYINDEKNWSLLSLLKVKMLLMISI